MKDNLPGLAIRVCSDSTPSISPKPKTLTRFVLLLLVKILLIIFPGTLSAQYAVTGLAHYKSQIFWLSWDSNRLAEFNKTNGTVQWNSTDGLPPGVVFTMTINNISNNAAIYTSGSDVNDTFDDLFGGLTANSITSSEGQLLTRNITTSLVINGTTTASRVVFADAGNSVTGESITINRQGNEGWYFLEGWDRTTSPDGDYTLDISGAAKNILKTELKGTDNGSPVGSYVMMAPNLSGFDMELMGAPSTALSIGLFLPVDYADALGYNAAGHLINKSTTDTPLIGTLGAGQTNDGQIYPKQNPGNYWPITNLTEQLYLGSTVDADPAYVPNAEATGDDLLGPDEDCTSIQELIIDAGGTYTVTTFSYNKSGSTANLYAWIDFNQNGLFEESEMANGGVASIVPSNPLNIPTITQLDWDIDLLDCSSGTIVAGRSYVRIRLTTETLTKTQPINNSQTGNIAPDGEVEDHVINIKGHDYGDLPASYGTPKALVNTDADKNGTPDISTSIWIGNSIDYSECSPRYSADASGDGFDDGLTEPDALIVNRAADWLISLSSQATVSNARWGLWFDWNGNGNFTDAADGFFSGTSNISLNKNIMQSVTPPADAASEFAVRLMVRPESQGDFLKSDYEADIVNGEVEDYWIKFPLKAYIIDQKNVPCYGGDNGEVTIEATGGTPPYLFSFNDQNNFVTLAGNNTTYTNLKAGNYIVYVRDQAGDQVEVNVAITQTLEAVSVSVTAKQDVKCFATPSGEATIAATGGTAPYRYFLNGVEVTQTTFTNLPAGNYLVEVWDTNNCTATTTFVINEPAAALTASIATQTNVDCAGNLTASLSITANGGTAPYRFSIDNGINYQNSNLFSNMGAGNYIIKVADSQDCTVDLPVTITEPAPITTTVATDQDVLCKGESSGSITATASGGTAPYRYTIDNWATENSTGIFSNLPAGNYTIATRDANNCETNVQATIAEPTDSLQATVVVNSNVDCFGEGTGSATVTASGGTAPYQYFFNGETTATSGSYTMLTQGSYQVIARDANGCETTVTITISGPDQPLTASVNTIIPPLCTGSVNASATITATGGTPGYNYSLNSGPVQTDPTFNNLPAGNYTITVTDTKGCTAQSTFTINDPIPLTLTVSNKQDVACFESASGDVTLTASGGKAPYQFTITNGSIALTNNTGQFSNLAPGNYTAEVTDVNLCKANSSFVIDTPTSPLEANVTAKTDIDCNNATGSFTLEATGGVAPYSYVLNGGTAQPAASYSNLAAGDYRVTITDQAGCVIERTVSIADLTQIDALLTADDNSVCQSIPVNFTASGGNEYEFLLNGTIVQSRSANATYSNSALQNGDIVTAEVYNTVTGCQETSNPITIEIYSLPVVTLQPIADVCSIQPAFSLSGGMPAGGVYSGNGVTNGTFDPAIAKRGTHTITYTYTNANGCSASATATIKVESCSLSLLKEATLNDTNGDNHAQVGETITYRFTLINGGDVDLTNLTITDAKVTVAGGPLAILAAGTTDATTFTATYTLNQADIDIARVENQATVTATATGNLLVSDLSDDPANTSDADPDQDSDPDDITITQLNVVPVAHPDLVEMDEDNQYNIDVLDNDTFGGNGPAANPIVITTPPLHGTVSIDKGANPSDPSDDIIIYKPNADYFGSDSFGYQICDSDGDCSSTTVSIDVKPVNDPPQYNGENFTTTEFHPIQDNLLQYVTDIDNLHSDITLTTTPVNNPSFGTVTLQPDGTFTYTPKMDFIGRDYFDVQICDNGTPNECITQRIYIDVLPDDECSLLIPNGFSPDGDGINETFKIRCLYNFPEAHIQIYNRWGSLVYEKKNYGNNNYWPGNEWWDGRSNNAWAISNEVLPSGTYVFILYLGNGEIKKGTIFLKR